MQTLTIRYGTMGARRLEWPSVLYARDQVRLRIEDPRELGIFEDADADECYLALATLEGTLAGVAGPFEAVLGPEPEGGGDAPVIAWQAVLDLRNPSAEEAFSILNVGARLRTWAGLLHPAGGSVLGVGAPIVEGSPFTGTAGDVPTIPGGSYVTRDAFSDLTVATPATLTTLREQLAAILAALQGS